MHFAVIHKLKNFFQQWWDILLWEKIQQNVWRETKSKGDYGNMMEYIHDVNSGELQR